jgi:hypothetical protein
MSSLLTTLSQLNSALSVNSLGSLNNLLLLVKKWYSYPLLENSLLLQCTVEPAYKDMLRTSDLLRLIEAFMKISFVVNGKSGPYRLAILE